MSLSWAELNNRIVTSATERGLPVSGSFELTARCNLRCKMCYVCHLPDDKNAVASELTAAEWIRLGQEARDAGLLFLTLTGGEVFLRKDFREIYEAFAGMGFNLTIYTNASLITREKARWLGAIPPSKVSVTVYGASPETYQKVTGSADAFGRTLHGLEALRSEGIKVEIKTTVVEGNYREFEQLSRIAKNYSVGLGIVNYISPRREGCGSDPMGNRLSPEDIAAYEKKIEEYNFKQYLGGMANHVQADLDTMIDLPVPSKDKRKTNLCSHSAFRCLAGRCGFWLTWDGRLTPCGLLGIPAAQPLENGFQLAWEKLKEDCSMIPKCMECSECSLRDDCMTCPARLMTETGTFDQPAAYLCDVAKSRQLLRLNQDGRRSAVRV